MMRGRTLTLLLLVSLGACATPATESAIRVDHVIIGVAGLDRGIAQVEQMTGVRPAIGGSHPGRGTRNALMSLGNGTYLELIAPDPAQSIDNDMVRELRSLTRPTPIGWAVSGQSTSQLRQVLERDGLRLSLSQPGSRQRPDGSVIHWETFDFEPADDPLLPFFIVWGDPALHPSRTSPAGCKLTRLQIDGANAGQMQRALKPLQLDVRVTESATSRMRIGMRCRGRRLVLE